MTERPRPRILIVTRNLPPLVGGMEQLNWHMAAEMAKYAEVRVIGPTGAAALAPSGVMVDEVPLSPLPCFLLGAQWKALRVAPRWRPHIVLAGSGLTAPLAWLAAKACRAKSVVYVHGLDMAVQHPLYRALWLPVIRRMDRVIANSQPTRQLARDAGVAEERIGIVHPGTALQHAEPDPEAIAAFRAKHQLSQRPLLLSVGRLSTRKGLREFVSDVLPKIVARLPDVMLLIVGDAPKRALHAEIQSAENIQSAANQKGVGGNIRFVGVIVDREELATVYQAADIHVFPVQHIPGDPEGFGMVAIESAAQGLPTVAYATGGIVDAVAEAKSGHLVPPGDGAAFADAVLRTMAERESLRVSAMDFAHQFGWPAIGAQMRAQMTKVVAHLSDGNHP